jgi:glycyl-tRNA synthetase alpha subunit
MLTFQEAVFALERFWADEGCLIWEPYYLQVGAGTMNRGIR